MTTQKTRFFPLQMALKNTRLHILQDPMNLVLRQARQQKGTRTQLGSRTTTCSKLLLGRTNRTRIHCFLQRTGEVHPRRKSAAQRDNMDQGRPVGISLPKSDVMLDQVLICTGQSQGRRGGSAQNYQMGEHISHHKTFSIYRHVLPDKMSLQDQSTSNLYHKTSSSYYKMYKNYKIRPGAALLHKLSYS